MAQQQKLDLALKGLYTSPNLLSGVPAGALEVADNVVINAKNLGESRRGQTQYGTPLNPVTGEVNKIFNYASSLIVNYGDKMAYDSGSGTWVNYTGTFEPPSSDSKMRSLEALRNFYFTTSAGIYKIDAIAGTPRPAGSPKALGGEGSLTGSSGFLLNDSAVAYRMVWGYTDANSNLILGAPSQRLIVTNSSGGPKDVSLTFPVPSTITTDFFYQIYRSQGTLTATDEPTDELQLVLQAQVTSGEIAAKEFTVTDSTPYSLMRATLYTSPSQEGIANANLQPPLALDMDVFKNCAFYANVAQKQTLSLALISVDLPSLGYLVDASVNTHTNFTLDGITSTADLRVGMRAVGTGIQANSIITAINNATTVTLNKATTATATVSVEFQDRFSIGGVNYWAGSAEDLPTDTFFLDNSSTPGTNINETAINLIRLINTSPSNTTIYAYYTSGIEDLPGQILFEERSIGGATFSATSTAGSSWSPPLPDIKQITAISMANPTVITSALHGLTTGNSITIYDSNSTPSINGERIVTVINANTFSIPVNVTVAGTAGNWLLTSSIVESNNEVKQNRVYVSKNSQVEAVPIYSYFDIGAANFPIQRVVALRDGIFFFKNDGIYRISGENFASFTVTLIDNTVALKVPESAVPFNNQVFCFTTQGIVAVTDSGAQLMSVPIEDTLLELSSDQFTNFVSASFGVAYESARLYMFFTVTREADTFATQAFVYNSLTESWTRWEMNRNCGVVNTSINKLFMAQPETGQVLIERKSYTNADYADEQYAVIVASVGTDTEMTLVSAANASVGMTIVQGNRSTVIEEINGNVLTVVSTDGFTAAAAIVYTPILNKVQWAPIDADNPGVLKQFSEVVFLFKDAAFREIVAGFTTNISTGVTAVPVLNKGSGGWGSFPWGDQPWGGVFGGANVLRTYVPREKQRSSWLTLSIQTNEAFTGFSLQGISLMYTPMSSWVK
jgi:hypothetical protein